MPIDWAEPEQIHIKKLKEAYNKRLKEAYNKENKED